MEYLHQFLSILLHLDKYIVSFVALHGAWTYLLAFAIIFCETGLVVVPFLPGDSLLFTLGSVVAQPQHPLSLMVLLLLLIVAAIAGNYVNYRIGRLMGPKVFTMPGTCLLNKKHLEETHRFYEKHGGKTIIYARFIPIIRTFAPFVAGISYMSISKFHLFNALSALLWISCLLIAGYFLGSITLVQENFTLVIYAIIGLSLLPPFIAFMHQKLRAPSKVI